MHKIEWSWFVPVEGEGTHVGTYYAESPPDIDSMIDIIQTAENVGFDTVLIQTGLTNNIFAEDAPVFDDITATAILAKFTNRIRLLMAVKTGEIHPALLAKMCATIDQISNGRLAINVTTGNGPNEAIFGDKLDHDSRYERTWEVVKILKLLWTEKDVSFNGKYYDIDHGLSEPKPVQKPHPPFYMVGKSEMARRISAEIAEAHLVQCDTVETVKKDIKDISARASKLGRTIRFGIRAQTVTRDTEKQAWDAVKEMMSQVDQRVIEHRNAHYAKFDKTERVDLIAKAMESNMIGPGVWGGMHLVRSGAGAVLVGSHEQVAETCLRYIDAGVGAFILSGYPMAEESKRFGENVIPLVESRLQSRVHKGTTT